MRMMHILLLLVAPFIASSQQQDCPFYDKYIAKGDSIMKVGKKPNFQDAINAYNTAMLHCPERAKEARDKIVAVFLSIEKLKTEAEKARNSAVTEKEKAKGLLAQVRIQKDSTGFALKLAKEQKDSTLEVLRKLETISNQAVTLLLKEIDRNIYQLEYDSTFEKCQTAFALNAQRLAVERRIWEIAYFYTEADTGVAAIPFLELIKPTGLKGNTAGLQQKLKAFLDKNIPLKDSAFIHDRYFPKLIKVEGGSFLRTDVDRINATTATVKLNTFQMAEKETTNWQYAVFAKANHIKMDPPSWQFAGDNPVVNVDWKQATLYLNWLSDRLEKKEHVYDWSGLAEYNYTDVKINYQGKGYRLPTEAEWEYAAGNGSKDRSKYAGTDREEELTDYAWNVYNSGSRTHPGGTKKRNPLGFYDMSGNVWEWCQDWYIDYDLKDVDNPFGSKDGSNRMIRGGSWSYDTGFCRVATRNFRTPEYRNDSLGFRAVFVP